MNSFRIARAVSQRGATARFSSKAGAIPTSSTIEVGGTKVIGLPHLSVSVPILM